MDTETKTASSTQVKRKDKFTGTVKKITLGGAMIDLGLDRPGFLHVAQIKQPVKRIEDVLTEGEEIDVWVRRANPGKDFIELTTSEPLALEWREIKKGLRISGTVAKIEKFGAFVDIGAERPGLVHVSEMSHDYVRTPEDVVKVGDQVEAMVLGVDRKKRQIKLSMKALVDRPEAIMKELNETERAADNTPVPNAMEFALRAAMEKSKGAGGGRKSKQTKSRRKKEMDDIFSRTLENYTEE